MAQERTEHRVVVEGLTYEILRDENEGADGKGNRGIIWAEPRRPPKLGDWVHVHRHLAGSVEHLAKARWDGSKWAVEMDPNAKTTRYAKESMRVTEPII